jgi:hypothetical protein
MRCAFHIRRNTRTHTPRCNICLLRERMILVFSFINRDIRMPKNERTKPYGRFRYPDRAIIFDLHARSRPIPILLQ